MEGKGTREKMIRAAIELFRQKGFKGTTTKKVAQMAGVNEVTLFRHFKNKHGLMEAAIDFFSAESNILESIEHQLVYSLEKDLETISHAYLKFFEDNKALILIAFSEEFQFPILKTITVQIPRELHIRISSYFVEMQKRGKITDQLDLSLQAGNYIWMNFGRFLSQNRFENNIAPNSDEDYITQSIALFARALQP